MTPLLLATLALLAVLLLVAGVYGTGWLYAFLLAKVFYLRVRGLHRISWLPVVATLASSLLLSVFYLLSEPAGNIAVGLASLVTSPLVVQTYVLDESGESIAAVPAWLAWIAILAINLGLAFAFAILLILTGIGSLGGLTLLSS